MSEYITVKEFASRAGVSPQAVYQRIDKDLNKFFKVVDGKKMLSSEGLSVFNSKEVEKELNQAVDNNALLETLKVLTEQLKVKDQQITDLMNDNRQKDETIKDLSVKLSDRLAESNELNRNNQVLLLEKRPPEQKEESSGFWSKIFK